MLRSLLLVEDNAVFARTLARELAAHIADLRVCGSVSSARANLATALPDALLLDVRLPDGGALDVLAAARARRSDIPVAAVSSEASPEEAFLLAKRGVVAFLAKPFTPSDLLDVLQQLSRALQERSAVRDDAHPGPSLGGLSLPDMETRLRNQWVDMALEQSGGNISEAARLLRISRQALQQILRRR